MFYLNTRILRTDFEISETSEQTEAYVLQKSNLVGQKSGILMISEQANQTAAYVLQKSR